MFSRRSAPCTGAERRAHADSVPTSQTVGLLPKAALNLRISSDLHPGYLSIAVVVSLVGAALAMNSAGLLRRRAGRFSAVSIGASSLALGGVGIWAMHFIGLLALRVDLGARHSGFEALASFAGAVLASALALGLAAHAGERTHRVAASGALLGGCVVLLHVVALHGMKFHGHIEWRAGVLAGAAVFCAAMTGAGFRLAFSTRVFALRGLAGVGIGAAVSVAYCAVIRAADFVCTADCTVAPEGSGYVSVATLSNAAILLAMLAAVAIAADQLYRTSGAGAGQGGMGEAASRF
jgi:NO-binding membrane sensor protein with MHYT domain